MEFMFSGKFFQLLIAFVADNVFYLAGIDSDKITADYKNGILIMVLPKKQPEAPASKKLTIN